MRTLRARFILSHVLPTLIILPIVALTLIYLLETQVLLTDLADDLTERALFIAEIINQQPAAWQDPDQAEDLDTNFGPYVDGTILILDAQGELLGSNNPRFQGNQDRIEVLAHGCGQIAAKVFAAAAPGWGQLGCVFGHGAPRDRMNKE